jgi:hypothetical protein
MLHKQCQDSDFKQMIIPLIASGEIIHNILDGNNATALDPATPAFFTHCTEWGAQYGEAFKILHDQSKPIVHNQEVLERAMSLEGPYQKIGYDHRTFEFPLRSDRINFGDSKSDARLQVVDLIAGSCNHWARGQADERFQDELWRELDHLDMTKLAIGAVWPSSEFTPEDIDMDAGGGVNPVDEIVRYINKSQSL